MAQSLSVQIALEGGKEVERQLADIGEEGQKAFQKIDQAAQQAGGFKNLKMGDVTAQLKEMGVTGVDSINQIKQAVRTAGKFEGLTAGARGMERGLAEVTAGAQAAGTGLATAVQGAQAATVAFGLTRRELGALRTTLKQVDLGPLGNQLVAMGRVGGAFGTVGIAIAGVGVAVAAATAATIVFAQSITRISAEAIKLGVSFQAFDDARKRLEALGISADAITAGFSHVKQAIDSLALERVARDADTVRQGLDGSDAALKRLKQTALQFTAAGNAAAEALRTMDVRIPGLDEKDIKKFGIELTRLKTLVEQFTGRKVEIDIEVTTDPVKRLEAIEELLRLLPDSAQRTAAALQLLGPSLGAELIQKLRLAEGSLSSIEANAIALTSAISQMGAAFARLGTVAFAPFITAEINAVTTAITALQGMIDSFSWATFTDAAMAAGNALKYFSAAGLASLAVQFAWDLSGFDSLITKITEVLRSLGLLSQAGGTPLPAAAPAGGPGIGGNARGGIFGGRGTGTSDSNLAWISRGEHIMPARAVRQPGVLAFLEALRRSGGNLADVLDGMGRFALGGMVPQRMAIPAFAAGGMVGGGHLGTLTLGLPSGEPVTVRAAAGVAAQLRREAAMAQVRSGGRKPSRYS